MAENLKEKNDEKQENFDFQQRKKEIELKKQERAQENKRRIRFQIFMSVTVLFVVISCIACSVLHKSEITKENPQKIKTNSNSSSSSLAEDSSEKQVSQKSVSETQPVTEAYSDNAVLSETPKKEKKTSESKKNEDLSELEKTLNVKLSDYSGEWSVYVKNLDTQKEISINNRQMYAASLIKLFAMASAYQQINDGILLKQNIYDTIYKMITVSSNWDFNSTVLSVGQTYITDWCRENGYGDTIQCHGLYPADNGDAVYNGYGSYNLTTVEDCGKLLESIYNGKCVSKEYSEEMLDILLNQELVNKIPAGLPENTKSANKTGETDDVCHDAAIVYSQGGDYIITVMVDNPGNAYSNTEDVAEVSEIVYDYFN